MSVTDWSIVQDDNATADPTIPAMDGASGRKMPDLVRGVMAKVAAYVLDQGGSLVTAGTSNAYVVTTNSGISALKPGVSVTFIADRDSTDVPTLNVDGTGPKPILTPKGIAVDGSALKAGLQYSVLWYAAAGGLPAGWRLKVSALVLNGNGFAALGHTSVQDTDYAALATDIQIGFRSITAPRVVALPDVDTFPLGQVLFIGDESGQCSVDRAITIQAGPGTSDTVAGQAAIQITDAYQGIGLRRGAANVWIIAR